MRGGSDKILSLANLLICNKIEKMVDIKPVIVVTIVQTICYGDINFLCRIKILLDAGFANY